MIPTITDDQISTALGTLLNVITPTGVGIYQGQANRVPEPTEATFIIFQVVNDKRLSLNVDTYDTDSGTVLRVEPTQVSYQLDIHGPGSTDVARAIKALWRSEYATAEIDGTVLMPLYASDGAQRPFINGQGQYEERWVLTIECQVNVGVVTSQDFAGNVIVTLLGA